MILFFVSASTEFGSDQQPVIHINVEHRVHAWFPSGFIIGGVCDCAGLPVKQASGFPPVLLSDACSG